MAKRIITTENLEEDIKIENHLRPQCLKDYIGQEKAKQTLEIYIRAARERGDALDHDTSSAAHHTSPLSHGNLCSQSKK